MSWWEMCFLHWEINSLKLLFTLVCVLFYFFFFPQSNIYFLKFWIANMNCLECSILISWQSHIMQKRAEGKWRASFLFQVLVVQNSNAFLFFFNLSRDVMTQNTTLFLNWTCISSLYKLKVSFLQECGGKQLNKWNSEFCLHLYQAEKIVK